jgi:hypothetical protein
VLAKGVAQICGRKVGTPNKFTHNFREAVLVAYHNIGVAPVFSTENLTEFSRIAARLFPTDLLRSRQTHCNRK